MTNWSYGMGVLPSDRLQESQGTGNVKNAINAISSAYETYKAYMMKAKDQNGNIIDQKSFEAAKQSLDKLGQAVQNVKNVLAYYETGLGIGNKKMGGGLDRATLKKLIGSCEKVFGNLKKQMLSSNSQSTQPGKVSLKKDGVAQQAGASVAVNDSKDGATQQVGTAMTVNDSKEGILKLNANDDKAMANVGIDPKVIQLLHSLNPKQQQVIQSILNK